MRGPKQRISENIATIESDPIGVVADVLHWGFEVPEFGTALLAKPVN